MRLKQVSIDREYLADFERHEGVFLCEGGREICFFFLIPKAYASWLSERSDHWFILGATSAALIGEDYKQNEPVSALLKRHMECLILQWKDWSTYKRQVTLDVPILADTETDPVVGEKVAGLYFTGGVDSTFTLARRFEQTDILLQAKFDWDDEECLVSQLRSQPKTLFGKELVCVGTNVLRAFPEFEDAWAYRTHGPALGALAHMFTKRLGSITFSSSRKYGTLIPWGSHPLTDYLLSSDQLAFEHYGTEFSRLDKIRSVAVNPEFLPRLEVCGQAPSVIGNKKNCSRCKKCLRTMIVLDLAGAPRMAATSFDWSAYGTRQIADIRLYHPNEYAVFRELKNEASSSERPEIAAAIATAMRKSYRYYPLGAMEGFFRRRYPTFIALWPFLKRAKHRLLGERRTRA